MKRITQRTRPGAALASRRRPSAALCYALRRGLPLLAALLIVLPQAAAAAPASAASGRAHPRSGQRTGQSVSTITVAPAQGPDGAHAAVAGVNFDYNVTVTIYWNDIGGTVIGTGHSDAAGKFTVNITIPSSGGAGAHDIVAQDATGNQASASFTVASGGGGSGGGGSVPPVDSHGASMQLSTQTANQGDTISVVGSHFVVNDDVTLHWDSATGPALAPSSGPATIHTDDAGNFATTIVIPTDDAHKHQMGHAVIALAQGKVRALDALTVSYPGQQDDGNFSLGPFSFNILDFIKAIFQAFSSLFSNIIASFFGPILQGLTRTPVLTDATVWPSLDAFTVTMHGLALSLASLFFVIALLRYAMASIVSGDFMDAIGAFRRTVVVLLALIVLPTALPQWFGLINWVSGQITGNDPTAIASAWSNPPSFPAGSNTGYTHLDELNYAIMQAILAIPFLIGVILVALQRLGGIVVLLGFYAMWSVAVVTWISPDFKPIAKWWFVNFVSYSLWGVAYAVVLRIVDILLRGDVVQKSGAADAGAQNLISNAFIHGLIGIASLFVLLKIPGIINAAMGGLSGGQSGSGGLAEASAAVGKAIVKRGK